MSPEPSNVLARLERQRDTYLEAERRDASLKDWNSSDRWRYMASGIQQAIDILAAAPPAPEGPDPAEARDEAAYWRTQAIEGPP